MIKYAISALFLLTLLLGCAIGQPVTSRDSEFDRQERELERKKFQTFVGSKEREAVDQQIIQHEHKWLLDFSTDDQPQPKTSQNEAEQIKKINQMIDKSLNEAKQSLKQE